ncbi:MAG: hypothetical protein PVF50_07695 [Gammaproteobacteria bacterium]|jgi:hypothetical protein
MFNVTDDALGHLSEALSGSAVARENECFRFVVKDDDRIVLAYQTPQSNDLKFAHEGTQVLAVPAALSDALSEKVLDVGDEGQLVFLQKPG